MEGIQVSLGQSEAYPDIAIINIEGYIDTTTSGELERILQNLLRDQKFKIVINLEKVDYISSAGWGIFISEIKNIRIQHGDLKLACMSESVSEVYELLEFSTILSSSDSVEDAINLFNQNDASAAAKKPVVEATGNKAPVAPKPIPPVEPELAPEEPEISVDFKITDQPKNTVEPIPPKATAPVTKPIVTLLDRVKRVIKIHPEWGAWKIKKELNRTRGMQAKVGWGEIRSELKYSKLNSKAARYRFARSN